MSLHGEIRCWRLTPEQIAAYKPGMDLGPPHWTEEPKTFREITPFNGRVTAKRKGAPARQRVCRRKSKVN